MHVNYGITVGLGIHKNWNNFNLKLSELLQTCLFFTKTEIVYIETGWELIYVRRKRGILEVFYNMVNTNTPNYLCILTVPRYKVHQCIP
jgi:hypothetical protein